MKKAIKQNTHPSSSMELSVLGLQTEFEKTIRLLNCTPARLLTIKNPIKPYGTIGQQFRHVVNFGRILINDWPSGTIDLTKKPTNPDLKTKKKAIRIELESLVYATGLLKDKDPRTELDKIFRPVANEPPVQRQTNLADMVDFIAFHTNHHIPIILLMIHIQNLKHDVSQQPLGIAANTLTNEKTR